MKDKVTYHWAVVSGKSICETTPCGADVNPLAVFANKEDALEVLSLNPRLRGRVVPVVILDAGGTIHEEE